MRTDWLADINIWKLRMNIRTERGLLCLWDGPPPLVEYLWSGVANDHTSWWVIDGAAFGLVAASVGAMSAAIPDH